MPTARQVDGPLAKALHGADEPTRALLLAALLQQAQQVLIDVNDAPDGTTCVQLRLALTPAAVASVLQAGPSPQALTAWIGLASI